MSYSKFRLLICFTFCFFFSLNINGANFSTASFSYKYNRLKFNEKIAINNLKFIETEANYNHYFRNSVISHSIKCFNKNRHFFLLAQKKLKVSPYVILGILTVETLCGKHTSKYNIVEVYKTLETIKFDKNIQNRIFLKLKKNYPGTTKKWFFYRVNKKYNWAQTQLKALKIIYLKKHIDIFNIKGSWAGAFGLPQFIPTTFLAYAIDGDNDNQINIFEFPDAIFSIANYLLKHGWNEKLDYSNKLKVIYSYNHSKLYCQTILKLANIFKQNIVDNK